MKWVKLIDKQPAISERCNLKIDGAPYTGSYWKPEGHKDSQIYYEHFSIDGKGIVPKSEFENIYWLDESQSGEGDAVDGWISVDKELPVRPEKKQYQNVQCGYYTPKGNFSQFIGFYAEKHKVPYEDYDDDDIEYDPVEESHGTLYLKPGWYELVETPHGAYDEVFMQRTVTHWQPLPKPPIK